MMKIQIIHVFQYVKRVFYCILFTDPPYLASQRGAEGGTVGSSTSESVCWASSESSAKRLSRRAVTSGLEALMLCCSCGSASRSNTHGLFCHTESVC